MEENNDENEQGSFRRNVILKEKEELKQKFIDEEISAEDYTLKKEELDKKLEKYAAVSPIVEKSSDESVAEQEAAEESADEKEIEIEEISDEATHAESHHRHHKVKHHNNEQDEPKTHDGLKSSSPFWMMVTVILAILLVISFAYYGGLFGKTSSNQTLDKQAAADKAVNYINTQLLTDGSKATFVSVEEKSGMYAIKLLISGKTVDAYVTKDGTLLFPAAMEITNGTVKPVVSTQGINVSLGTNPILGPENAKITIVEFSDYQCPFCSKAEMTVRQVYAAYNGSVRLAYRDFPLPANVHPYAQKAAEAVQCANEQGKYWEYHNLLFDKQSEWSPIGYSKFKEYAVSMGLNATQFNNCLDSGKYASTVAADASVGSSYGVSGTPTFFINGQTLVGAQPFSAFKAIIDAELAK